MSLTPGQQQTRIEQLTGLIEQAQQRMKSTGTVHPELGAWMIERESLIQQIIREQGITHDLTGQEEELAPETPAATALKLANSVYAQIAPTPTTDLELARIYAELALTRAVIELNSTIKAREQKKIPVKRTIPRKAEE